MTSLHHSLQVKINTSPLEDEADNPDLPTTTDPMPIRASTCFDELEITVNWALLDLMEKHLKEREEHPELTWDMAFDCWLHSQLYTTEFNKY